QLSVALGARFHTGLSCIGCRALAASTPAGSQNENPARFPKAGSREPSWCGRYEELCYGGSASQTHGRGKGSSRNVRYKQPVRHRSWKCRITDASPLGTEIASASPAAVLNSTM